MPRLTSSRDQGAEPRLRCQLRFGNETAAGGTKAVKPDDFPAPAAIHSSRPIAAASRPGKTINQSHSSPEQFLVTDAGGTKLSHDQTARSIGGGQRLARTQARGH